MDPEIYFADGSACSRATTRHEETSDGRHLMHYDRRIWCDDADRLDTCDAAVFARGDKDRAEAAKAHISDMMRDEPLLVRSFAADNGKPGAK